MVGAASSYPVLWSEPDGRLVTGQLAPGLDALQLQGASDGAPVQRVVMYSDLAGVRVGRASADLLDGRPTLVVERHRAPDLLVRPLGPGLLSELAEVLAELCARGERVERIAVVLPLEPGALDAARALVSEGPPFDPSDKSLARHEVFLTTREAIFVFSGADACESVRQIVRDADVWVAAERWRAVLSGPPRLAEAAFVWAEDEPLS
jgi:hypothetical protein